MPVTIIKTSATTQIKTGPGTLEQIIITAQGTTWNMQILDGPTMPQNTFTPLIGSTTTTLVVPAVGTVFLRGSLTFTNGLQIVTTGASPGEVSIVWQ